MPQKLFKQTRKKTRKIHKRNTTKHQTEKDGGTIQSSQVHPTDSPTLSEIENMLSNDPDLLGTIIWKLSIISGLVLPRGRVVTNKDAEPYERQRPENLRIFKALLQHERVDVNKESGWQTPLCFAIAMKSREVIELLLQHKDIDVNKISHSTGADWTPLGYATVNGQVDEVELLLQHPDIDVNKISILRNPDLKMHPIYIAATRQNKNIVKILAQHPDIDIHTPIEETMKQDIREETKQNVVDALKIHLIKKSIKSQNNAKLLRNKLPKDITMEVGKYGGKKKNGGGICSSRECNFFKYIREGNMKMVKQSIRRGIDINKHNKYYQIPISEAIKENQTEIALFLLQQPGMDVNDPRFLYVAIEMLYYRMQRFAEARPPVATRLEIVKALLQHQGIQVNRYSRASRGWTPLTYAIFRGLKDVVELLLQHKNIDVNERPYVFTEDAFPHYYFVNRRFRGIINKTPIYIAAVFALMNSEGKEIVKMLAERTDIDIQTAIDEALAEAEGDIVDLLKIHLIKKSIKSQNNAKLLNTKLPKDITMEVGKYGGKKHKN